MENFEVMFYQRLKLEIVACIYSRHRDTKGAHLACLTNEMFPHYPYSAQADKHFFSQQTKFLMLDYSWLGI